MAATSLYGTPATVEQASFSSSWSLSYTLANSSGGTSRGALIDVEISALQGSSVTVSNVQFGGETAVLVDGAEGAVGPEVAVYTYFVSESKLANLTEGNSYNVTLSLSSARNGVTAVRFVKGAEQSVANFDHTVNQFENDSTPSGSLTVSNDDSFVYDTIAAFPSSSVPSADAGQTGDYALGDVGEEDSFAGSHKTANSGSTTFGWSNFASTSDPVQVIVAIPPGSVNKDYSDNSTGDDAFSIPKRAKTITDDASGEDTYSKFVVPVKNYSDIASGLDTFESIQPIKKDFVDVATGSDEISVAARTKTYSDPGSGDDLFQAIQPLKKDFVDVSTGEETFSIPRRKKTYTDTGTGEDTFSAKKPQKKDYSDVASGTDEMGVVKGRVFADTAVGSDAMYKFVRKNNDTLEIEDPVILFELYDD